MGAFSQNLSSMEWWLGVVAVGILLNIISAYLKPWIDKRISSVWQKWGERTARAREERAILVNYIKSTPTSNYTCWQEKCGPDCA